MSFKIKIIPLLYLFLLSIIIMYCSGTKEKIEPVPPYTFKTINNLYENIPTPLNSENPLNKGLFDIRKIYFGSKNNPKRKEYQAENVDIKTESVNLSYYYDDVKTNTWGYDASECPVNGILYIPYGENIEDTLTVLPLVICVHGNHTPLEFSEGGYDYLGKHLTSHGFIFASIDQNFLNGNGRGRENDARAVHILETIKQILKWNDDDSNPLYNKIDENNIALIGHSRGGEAVVTASLMNHHDYYLDNGTIPFDWNYSIKAVISLAPVEGQYRPGGRHLSPTYLNYLVLHGSHDGDVDYFAGTRFLNRNLPDKNRFRSALWIYGANHSQFNSIWAKDQDPDPTNKDNLLSVYEQQDITKIYTTAFLKVSFGIDSTYTAMFKDYRRALQWLPETLYINRHQDHEGIIIADFEDDERLETATKDGWRCEAYNFVRWKENPLPLKKGNQESFALFLRWYSNNEYPPVFMLKTELAPIEASRLVFDISYLYKSGGDDYTEGEEALPDKVLDFTIRLRTMNDSVFSTTLTDNFTIIETPKIYIDDDSSRHAILQTIDIDFKEIQNFGETKRIKSIEFVFDKTENCYIAIDNILLK